MKSNKFTLPEISKIDFSIMYFEDDGVVYNQNESHMHKAYEIYLNLNGDVVFEVENRIYPISRGSMIITKPYEFHHCICRSNDVHSHYWITFSVDENMDFLKDFFNREKGIDNLIILDEQKLETVCRILNTLLQKDLDLLHQQISFLNLVDIITHSVKHKSVGFLYDLSSDVSAALTYMDENLLEDFSIKNLAAISNVSVNTLERHFKAALGRTPFEVFQRKKLINSLKYLRSGDTVSETALKSGFAAYSNYIQLFRKQFGLTPLQYKKEFAVK